MPERGVEALGMGQEGNIQEAEAMGIVFLKLSLQPWGRAPEPKHTVQEGKA